MSQNAPNHPTSSRLAARVVALACLSLLVSVGFAFAEEVEVTITALVPSDGVFLTPVWIGFHDGTFDLYDRDAPASAELERLAEDGNTGPLTDLFAVDAASGVQATVAGAAGPLMAGETVRYVTELDPAVHRYFSYSSMIIPSNDAFIANGNPLAHRVFDPSGNLTSFTATIYGREVLDAGTEVNDEAEESTAALGQAAADTGTVEGGVVTLHPGLIPGGRVLTARPNGDFTVPGYPIARITISRAPATTITFTGDGGQEVPPVETTATAACHASLNETLDRLSVFCEHDVEDAVAAHVHEGVAGENGPVVLPFGDAANPLNETFDVDAAEVTSLLEGGLYVNIHSEAVPSGEVRAQIDGCFEGPTGLCLNDERFQVTSAFSTASGENGVGQARVATADSGQFTFFDPDNVEIDIKVLDGCAINNHYWVFIAGLTDVEVDINVLDTLTDAERTYNNPLGSAFETIRDVEAFPCS